jgi:hypothetical protein
LPSPNSHDSWCSNDAIPGMCIMISLQSDVQDVLTGVRTGVLTELEQSGGATWSPIQLTTHSHRHGVLERSGPQGKRTEPNRALAPVQRRRGQGCDRAPRILGTTRRNSRLPVQLHLSCTKGCKHGVIKRHGLNEGRSEVPRKLSRRKRSGNISRSIVLPRNSHVSKRGE